MFPQRHQASPRVIQSEPLSLEPFLPGICARSSSTLALSTTNHVLCTTLSYGFKQATPSTVFPQRHARQAPELSNLNHPFLSHFLLGRCAHRCSSLTLSTTNHVLCTTLSRFLNRPPPRPYSLSDSRQAPELSNLNHPVLSHFLPERCARRRSSLTSVAMCGYGS